MRQIGKILILIYLISFGLVFAGCASGLDGLAAPEAVEEVGEVVITFTGLGDITFKGVAPIIVGSAGVTLTLTDSEGNPYTADELTFDIGYVETDGSCNTTSGFDLGSMDGLTYVPPATLPNDRMSQICILAYFASSSSINLMAVGDTPAGRINFQLRLANLSHVYRLLLSDEYTAFTLAYPSMFTSSDNTLHFCWSNTLASGALEVLCTVNETIVEQQPLYFEQTSLNTLYSSDTGADVYSDINIGIHYETDQPMVFSSFSSGGGYPELRWLTGDNLDGTILSSAKIGKPTESGDGIFNDAGNLASSYSQADAAWAVCYKGRRDGVDSEGDPAILFGIYCSVTSDGENYTTPVLVSNYESPDLRHPEVFYQNGEIYVVWSYYNTADSPTAGDLLTGLYFAKSTDNGQTYSDAVAIFEKVATGPVNVIGNPLFINEIVNPSIVVSSESGIIHLIWESRNNTPVSGIFNAVYYSKSEDGGSTFSWVKGSVGDTCSGSYCRISTTDDAHLNSSKLYLDPYERIHIMWRDSLGGLSAADNLYYRYSLDEGNTFTNALNTGIGAAEIFGMMSDLAGRLYVGVASLGGGYRDDTAANAHIYVITQEESTYSNFIGETVDAGPGISGDSGGDGGGGDGGGGR